MQKLYRQSVLLMVYEVGERLGQAFAPYGLVVIVGDGDGIGVAVLVGSGAVPMNWCADQP
jgi:hypothetical protein